MILGLILVGLFFVGLIAAVLRVDMRSVGGHSAHVGHGCGLPPGQQQSEPRPPD